MNLNYSEYDWSLFRFDKHTICSKSRAIYEHVIRQRAWSLLNEEQIGNLTKMQRTDSYNVLTYICIDSKSERTLRPMIE